MSGRFDLQDFLQTAPLHCGYLSYCYALSTHGANCLQDIAYCEAADLVTHCDIPMGHALAIVKKAQLLYSRTQASTSTQSSTSTPSSMSTPSSTSTPSRFSDKDGDEDETMKGSNNDNDDSDDSDDSSCSGSHKKRAHSDSDDNEEEEDKEDKEEEVQQQRQKKKKKQKQKNLLSWGTGFKMTTTSGTVIEGASAIKKIVKKEPFGCDQCGKRFKTSQALGSHRSFVHPQRATVPVSFPTILEVSGTTNERACAKRARLDAHKKAVQERKEKLQLLRKKSNVDGRTTNLKGGAKHRKTYEIEYKSHVLDLLECERDSSLNGAQHRVEVETGVHQTTIARWWKQKQKIHQLASLSVRARLDLMRRRRTSCRRKWKDADDRTYKQFLERQRKGLRASPRWISSVRRKLHKKIYGIETRYNAGKSWRQKWRKRYKVSIRRKTNGKQKSKENRFPIWRRFIWGLQRLKEEHIEGSSDYSARYGAYHPLTIYSEDQVPCPFSMDTKTTYAKKGSTEVQVASPKEADTKRFCTLHLCFRGAVDEKEGFANVEYPNLDFDWNVNGEQPPQVIIFRGKGLRLSEREKNSWDKRIVVMFQPKAWVDRPTYKHIVESRNDFFEKRSNDEYRLIIKDNLDAQTLPATVNMSDKNNVKDWFCPEGQTDGTQAVDDGLGNFVKNKMDDAFEDWLDADENADKWANGSFAAWEKRVLLTKWYANALAHVFQQYETLFAYHRHVGNYLGPVLDGQTDPQGVNELKPGGITGWVLGPEPPIIPIVAGTSRHRNELARLGQQHEETIDEDDATPEVRIMSIKWTSHIVGIGAATDQVANVGETIMYLEKQAKLLGYGYGVQNGSHLRVSYDGGNHVHTCGHFRRVDAIAAIAAPGLVDIPDALVEVVNFY